MKNFFKVEGHSQLVKNPKTGTMLNTNSREIEHARKRKKARKQNLESELKMKEEIESLRTDMDDIKSMLQQLIEKE